MFNLGKEKRIANKIREMLNKRGFVVKMKISKKTKSVYLKIDNGACPTIRISDHKNYKTNSKFNVIKNYEGKRFELHNGKTRIFYNFNMLGRLIADVENERSNIILKYGYTRYKTIRDRKIYNNNYYICSRQAA
ncbi:MAG: hypothetical protein ACLSW4_02450 [Clostridia bacterium]|nr:hypothetical protein [Clostridium sp.]HJJ12566.1 hypothetical protein [Clostridiaceae bacterium]